MPPSASSAPGTTPAATSVPTSAPITPGPTTSGAAAHLIEQTLISAGSFVMGDSSGDRNEADGEVPQHPVTVDAFSIDVTTVTNDNFARFIDDTGYRTEAETFGYSAVFHLAVAAPPEDVMGRASGAPWWFGVTGADWKHPGGRSSSLEGLGAHPVVHISFTDAEAYCAWAGRRLPTEAQWECASRGGLDQKKYPWGDDEVDAGSWRANIWQGDFPHTNTLNDGYLTTAPVRTFEPNGYGLFQTVGNVWEWCSDWFNADYYASSTGMGTDTGTSTATGTNTVNPAGPAEGTVRVLRGGSYLCHISYCNRYRNSARSQNTPDSSMGNAGFRTVAL
ncbi:Sulfatase modifying factor 1 precursor (C-alpha-formyglycine- generating enzyme 1) [Leifsonia rubra CMS 76R]|nr:Sulfatase modifying factor 1 precursor (C-alpha-formyglycine- generating enzyme 1) [Leifsonia rubra CMS 76R]